MENKVNNYYSKYSNEFIESTKDCDMSLLYEKFEKYLPKHASVLDLGFGSGRDSLYFLKKYNVTAIDPCKEFCDHAKTLGIQKIVQISAENMQFSNKFDGIWACASLLHIQNPIDLVKAFNNCYKALKNNGIMYCSFKYGKFSGYKNGRFYRNLYKNTFKSTIKNTDFIIKELFISEDVRNNKKSRWLNAIVIKR